jgi:hypothetical protein
MESYFALVIAVLLLINYSLASVVGAQSVDREVTNSTELQEDEISLLFKQYVIRHNKTYLNDPKEYYKRQQVFKVYILCIQGIYCVFKVYIVYSRYILCI